jgi:hypothetical protein
VDQNYTLKLTRQEINDVAESLREKQKNLADQMINHPDWNAPAREAGPEIKAMSEQAGRIDMLLRRIG